MAARAFLKEHLRALSARHDVALVTGEGGGHLAAMGVPGADFVVPIERKIALGADLRTLFALWRLFRAERFDAVHSMTPKGGLLAMAAARLAGVPRRTHWFTGQVWATRTGAMRTLLKTLDRVTFACSTFCLVDGPSQRRFLIDEGVVTESGSAVLADGSTCGVDPERFRPDAARRADLRARLGFGDEAVVFLFVGRLTFDKGLLDLAAAFRHVAAANPAARLLIVGADEDGVEARMKAALGPAAELTTFHPETPTPEAFMAASDVFCLPSYREGFNMAVIEAAAAGLPVIASRIYGIVDGVEDGVGGFLHAPHDPTDLAERMRQLAASPESRQAMGAAGRRRAVLMYPTERLIAAMTAFYAENAAGAAP